MHDPELRTLAAAAARGFSLAKSRGQCHGMHGRAIRLPCCGQRNIRAPVAYFLNFSQLGRHLLRLAHPQPLACLA
jgi:hypothetical protein